MPARPLRLTFWPSAFVLLASAAVCVPASAWEWDGVLKAGLEYDDNAERVVGDDRTGPDGGLRVLASGDARHRFVRPWLFDVSGELGGRLMALTHDESTLVSRWRVGITHRPVRRWWWGLSTDGRDRTEYGGRRDYLRTNGWVESGTLPTDWLQLRARGGYSWFHYKPLPELDRVGPAAGVDLTVWPHETVSVMLTGAWSRAQTEEPRFGLNSLSRLTLVEGERVDTVWHAGASVDYAGERVLARLGYSYDQNQSNSYARSYTRRAFDVACTAAVVGDLLLHAQGTLQWTEFRDPTLLDEGLVLEDENRNVVSVTLEYPLGARLDLEARYTRQWGAFSGDDATAFGRNLAYLGLAIRPALED